VTAGIATVVYVVGILGLFWLDRDPDSRTSKALWIPVAWLLIAGSRPVSMWLHMAPPTDQTDVYLEGSPVDRFLFTTLLAIGCWVLIMRGRRVTRLLSVNWPILLFFLYCALSAVWSDYPEVAFKRWIKALGDLVMVLIVLTDIDPSAAVKRFLARSGFVLIPLSVLLIKYYDEFGRGYNRWTWTPYYTGVTTGKNILGMICSIFGLVSLWLFFEACRSDEERFRKKGRLIAHGTLLGMVVWLFWMANSVTSLTCFLMASGLIVSISLHEPRRRPMRAHFLVAAALSLTLFALFFDSGGNLVETLGRNSTLTGRTDIWSEVVSMVGNPLLGTGFESFWLGARLEAIWGRHWWHPNEAHNGYLEVFLNLGWIGVTLLAVVMVTGYRNIVGALRRDEYASGLRLGYFLVATIYSLTEAGFRMMCPMWIAFLLATTVVPEAAVREGSDINTQLLLDEDWASLSTDGADVYEEVV